MPFESFRVTRSSPHTLRYPLHETKSIDAVDLVHVTPGKNIAIQVNCKWWEGRAKSRRRKRKGHNEMSAVGDHDNS